jgi:hypothetical protein
MTSPGEEKSAKSEGDSSTESTATQDNKSHLG